MIQDVGKAVGLGLALGGAIALLVTLGALPFTTDLEGALVLGQRMPLLLGAGGLLIFSGLLLKKGGLPPLQHQESFRRWFPVLSYGAVLLLASAAILLCAAWMDYLIFALRLR